MISTGDRAVIVAFTPTGRAPHRVEFALSAAGEEYQKAGRIGIASVKLVDAKPCQKVGLKNDVVELLSESTERAFIEIETSESVENVAFRMRVQK